MSRRSIIVFSVLALVLLCCIGWLFYSLFFGDGDGTSVRTDRLTEGVEAVPSDAIFVFEASDLSEIADMTDDGSALGRLLGCIPESAYEWEAALSMHYSSKNAVSPLLVLSVPEDEDAERVLSDVLDECSGVIDKRYGQVMVHKSAVPDVSFAVYGRFLVASPSLVIVEASLRHLDNGTSVKDEPLYNQISGASSDRGVLHVNMENIGKLFSGAAAPDYVRYASAFQSFADWTALGLGEGDSPRVFEGRAVSLRQGERLCDVLLSQRGRRPEAWSVVPYSASYMLTLPITSYSDYIRAYSSFVASDGRRNDYEYIKASVTVNPGEGKEKVTPDAFVRSLDPVEVAVFALDADGGRRILAVRCGNEKAVEEARDTVIDFSYGKYLPAVLGGVFAPSSGDSWCVLGDWAFMGGREDLTALRQSRAAGTFFSLADYLSQTPASGELRELSCLSLMVNAGRYADAAAAYFKEPYSETVRGAFGKKNLELLFLNTYKAGNELGLRFSLYQEDLSELPQLSGAGEGTAGTVVEDMPVTVPEGPFPVKNFVDGSQNWLEQLDNYDLRLLGASRNPVWTVKFDAPVCGTVRQIDYLKNNKLQMLFGAGDKVWLLDRLGRKVGRFPISLGKEILLGPDVYDFNDDKNYTMMVLHTDNTLCQYDIDGKPIPGWNPVTLSERIMSLPEQVKIGDRIYWAVRTSYQALLYDVHGTICADFSRKNKLRKDTEFEPVSSHEVAVTAADGRELVLDISDGSFRKR